MPSAMESTASGHQLPTESTSKINCDNWTNLHEVTNSSHRLVVLWQNGQVRIPLYSILFLLCVLGNGFVILTLVRDKRMRTVTNVFLLNLAISDLLLGTFCIPFTLVGTLLREFIFGHIMCKLIPYLQAVSVAVSAWTLVAMSIERYYAICHPLRARRWQTCSHAKKMIWGVWIGSLILMLPIASLSQLIPLREQGKYKCREIWPDKMTEQGFTILLDTILLIVPLIIMIATYWMIGLTLRAAVQSTAIHRETTDEDPGSSSQASINQGKTTTSKRMHCSQKWDYMRRTNADKAFQQKKRVIIMLIVVVMEFFICWGPLYAVNTISMFAPYVVYDGLGYTGLSLIQLFAHASSISNPITYCFLNKKFRQSFIAAVSCQRKKRSSAMFSMFDGSVHSKSRKQKQNFASESRM